MKMKIKKISVAVQDDEAVARYYYGSDSIPEY